MVIIGKEDHKAYQMSSLTSLPEQEPWRSESQVVSRNTMIGHQSYFVQ